MGVEFLTKRQITYLDIILSNVVFPNPFLPTSPYLLPNANVISAAVSRTLKQKLLPKKNCYKIKRNNIIS